MLPEFHACLFLFNVPCYGDQEPIVSVSETWCQFPPNTFIFQAGKKWKKNAYFKGNRFSGLKILATSTDIQCTFGSPLKTLQLISCVRKRNTSRLLFCHDSNCKRSFSAVESLEERRLCLVYYHFFTFAALCHASREKLYNAKQSHSTQVLTVHSPILLEQSSSALSIN